MEDRIVTSTALAEEAQLDLTLRPRRLEQFIGQEKIRSNLAIFIAAALQRREPLDHVLLKGPPGLGKTTLANIIAEEMGTPIRITSGPAVERPADLAAILTNVEPGTVLFIDEIHRLSRPVEEILYPAMEDFKLDIVIGKGPGAQSIRLDLPRFTIVGATTRAGLLTGPLRDRFGIVHDFEYYDEPSLQRIVVRSAGILGIELDSEGAEELSRRSRGTPRIVNRLLRRTRDFAQHLGRKAIDREVASFALAQLEIDERGLDRVDRALLRAIIENYGGGPVGADTLAAAISEDTRTIEDVYEPYLLQQGYLQRTPRGRMATERAYEALGIPPHSKGGNLFS